jgi:predicted DNA-binding WGR domain protein
VIALVDDSAAQLDLLPSLLDPLRALHEAPAGPLNALRTLPLDADGIEWAAGRRVIDRWFGEDRAIARLDGGAIERRVAAVAEQRRRLLNANSRAVQARVRAGFLDHVRRSSLPAAQLDAAGKAFKKTYTAGRRELEHEFGKVMRHRSIRDLIGGPAGPVIADLKPVWLMSPLSVSDTLPLDPGLFDLVIFDEASQVPLEDAVPSLHRAQQVIVVGDQMQLPPTSFFAAKTDEDDDDLTVDEDGETISVSLDGDSFLNQSAANLPSILLAWHYRSRSEALIAFSNAAFYAGALRTIPERALRPDSLEPVEVTDPSDGPDGAAALLRRPISFHRLPAGVYDQRRNQPEAAYIAELVRSLLAKETGLSIGIVAFSEAQQSAIEDALAALAADDPDLAARLDAETNREEDDQFVGLFVKNLENVQGDERDIIILSVCYGPDPTGRIRMNFGPINTRGGEKRLNVIFSRAKHHMAVVTSMRSQDITNDWNEGADALKAYLRFAEASSTGHTAQAGAVLGAYTPQGRARLAGRPVVLDQIAAALTRAGLLVDTDLGTSTLRCDFAVRRPGETEHQLAVLLDHRPPDTGPGPADDHERYVDRPRALAAIGWQTTHVLAKDWLADPDAVVARIVARLDGPPAMDEATERPPARARRRPPPRQSDPEPEPEPEATIEPSPSAEVEPPRPKRAPRAVKRPAPAAEPPAPTTPPEPALPPAPPPMPDHSGARRFELVDDRSSKFWQIVRNGALVYVTFGRIGTTGQTQIKDLGTESAAASHVTKLIGEKTRKGYTEV